MKRPLYLILCAVIVVLTTITTIVFWGKWKEFLPAIIGIVSIFVAFVAIVPNQKKGKFKNRRYLENKDFFDRISEKEEIIEFIRSNERLKYIKGNLGIGKTLFLKKLADDINHEEKLIFSKNPAIYIHLDATSTISELFRIEVGLDKKGTWESISKRMNKISKKKYVIILIDSIDRTRQRDFEDFVNDYAKWRPKDKFIAGIEHTAISELAIELSVFNEIVINEMAENQDVTLSDQQKHQIMEYSKGLPIYIEYLLADMKKNPDRRLENFHRIQDLIQEKIEKLTDPQQKALKILAYGSITEDSFRLKNMSYIDECMTEDIIQDLVLYSLVHINEHKEISIPVPIAEIYRDLLRKDRFEMHGLFYNFFKEKLKDNKKALRHLLLSNIEEIDPNFIIDTLNEMTKDNQLFYILKILDIDNSDTGININIRTNKNKEYTYIKYYCLKALLNLGEYTKAREYTNSIDFIELHTALPGIRENVDFNIHFLLADLEHLTNHFDESIVFFRELKRKAEQLNFKEKIAQCDWAIGHSLRHLGVDFESSIDFFNKAAKRTKVKDIPTYVKSKYSIISIHLFLENKMFDYKGSFESLFLFLDDNPKYSYLKSRVNRHWAIYQRKMCEDGLIKAETTLKETIYILENTGDRIKYDFYFELAEVYRHFWIHNNENKYIESALNYYKEAIRYSEGIGDYNLYSNAVMGIILLEISASRFVYSDDIDDQISKIMNIVVESKEYKLHINEMNAQIIKAFLLEQSIDQATIRHLEELQYSHQLKIIQSMAVEGIAKLDLTVM